MTNIDPRTVASFGDEWAHFDQTGLQGPELQALFDSYFHIFPWHRLPPDAAGADIGCGSGRWAQLVAPRVGHLTCMDAAPAALDVARRNLSGQGNVRFLQAGVSDGAIPDGSLDFAYSLGVLHHIPDTAAAMASCVRLLRPGAPFLVYLYYRFDNKPRWYAALWWLSNLLRRVISALPERPKTALTNVIAALVYLPLARLARLGARMGLAVDNWLLSAYRDCSFYTMRTDSRDRFGTPLEQRFTRAEIAGMMDRSGLENLVFSDRTPFWCAVGTRKPA